MFLLGNLLCWLKAIETFLVVKLKFTGSWVKFKEISSEEDAGCRTEGFHLSEYVKRPAIFLELAWCRYHEICGEHVSPPTHSVSRLNLTGFLNWYVSRGTL